MLSIESDGRVVRNVVLDLFEGRVESKVGRTTFRFGKTNATGSIDGRSFTLSNTQARALFALPRYRVYFFRRTRQVAGAEAMLSH